MAANHANNKVMLFSVKSLKITPKISRSAHSKVGGRRVNNSSCSMKTDNKYIIIDNLKPV